MLGRACVRRLRERGFANVESTQRRDPSGRGYLRVPDPRALAALLRGARYEYVINCLAVLASRALEERDEARLDAIALNADFPLRLAAAAASSGARVLHVSTDGVFSGRKREPYTEDDPPDPLDVYGRTKALGESRAPNALTVRCSLVGVAPQERRGLVEWFLSTEDGAELTGFSDQRWNGVTTLQLADAFASIVETGAFDALRSVSHVHHFCPNPAITKFDLLVALNAASGERRRIVEGSSGSDTFGRVLASRFGRLDELVPQPRDWVSVLRELLSTR